MTLMIALALLLQVSSGVVHQPPVEVFGYVNESITLPSGANSSWKLSRIEWSIFSNNTWIATYFSNKINTQRFIGYKDRLTLNSTTGSLTIRNLRMTDAREYTVDLSDVGNRNNINKIRLTVNQRLQTPIITVVKNSTEEGGCFLELNCSSPDENVTLSWDFNHSAIFHSKTGHLKFNNTENYEFTCVSSRRSENRSQVFKQKCVKGHKNDPEQEPQDRNRCSLVFLVGLLVGLIPSILYNCCPEYFKTMWQSLKERLCVKGPSS